MVRRLPERGLSVIIVSHNIDHVVRVADRAAVMRQGRSIGEMTVRQAFRNDLVAMMMGVT